ncbi:hypothetical protein C7C46_01920 [Streptomyces tateyamensis]|uniref:Uncharacterized protein n=1 Tax=Streptomyces tateyamensis TaxID=565073 RepID=A0A2V4PAE9_9ACTN|nr:sigma-70 family RNA polymerase sigma factor [Streptomyces tateyamensis]PYC88049.1 hypothetical protein C7C46_01920 [Streptomyces tateyamensis]
MDGTQDDSLTDDTLWARARDGDADAFGVLFTRHADAVYTYCFRRTASWSAAEDLVSVVFMETWRCRQRLSVESGSALPLLFGIAHRSTQKHHRSLTRHQAALRRLPALLQVPDPADDVAQRMDDEHRMRRLRENLRALPRRERDVLELCVLGELDYGAAAAALGVAVGTVRSRLSRARARLRQLDQDAAPSPVALLAQPSLEELS